MSQARTNYTTIINQGVSLVGEFKVKDGVLLQGFLAGSITTDPGAYAHLHIASSGRVKGSVQVPGVVIDGIVEGEIDCSGDLVLREGARVTGDVRYGRLQIAAGARVEGQLTPYAEHQGEVRVLGLTDKQPA